MNPEALKAQPGRKPTRNARSRSREFALQGLYQVLVGRQAVAQIDDFTQGLAGFGKADSVYYDTLLRGCAEQAEDLDARIAPHLDRPLSEISPIERAVMWMGTYELMHCLEVPWRVTLNECIELTKQFGGTDGHKYVNAVLHAMAQQLRPQEALAPKAAD